METEQERRPSIALVVLDTLRRDAFEAHFDWLPGIRYDNAYSTSHWTTPAHASMFTGQYPSEHGVHAKSRRMDVPESTLPEQLRDNGYYCRGWSANAHISSAFGFDRGFDEYREAYADHDFAETDLYDWRSFMNEDVDGGLRRYLRAVVDVIRSEHPTMASLRAGLLIKLAEYNRFPTLVADAGASTVPGALEELDDRGPEFLFLNLMEVHSPYVVPDEYYAGNAVDQVRLSRSLPEGEVPSRAEDERDAYAASASYLSDVYRGIFARLRDRYDYVITVSDHGHLLGEHGLWTHNYGLYPELTHVPLSINAGEDTVSRDDRVVSLLDIYATICSLSGIEYLGRRGAPLLEAENGRGEPRLVEYNGLTPFVRAGLREDEIPEDTVADLDTPLRGVAAKRSYYGYESRDGFVESGDLDESDSGGQLLNRLTADLEIRDVPDDQEEVPAEVRRRLEDLGYA